MKNPLYTSPVGHVHADLNPGPIRVLVKSGPCSPCAYLGLPRSHPLAGKEVDLAVHGGVTYCEEGDARDNKMVGRWWWGWDYFHGGDRAYGPGLDIPGREYTLAQILREATEAAAELLDLAQREKATVNN